LSEDSGEGERAGGERLSERSDTGTTIVPEVFGFVKKNLSGPPRRRKSTDSAEEGIGKSVSSGKVTFAVVAG
jgi:hypothetical protein